MIKGQGVMETTETGVNRESNEGRGRFDLLPYEAIEALAKWYEDATNKYPERNWEKGMSVKDCINRMIRHSLKAGNGWTDEDHLAAVMWNAAAAITMMQRRPDLNDHIFKVEETSKTSKDEGEEVTYYDGFNNVIPREVVETSKNKGATEGSIKLMQVTLDKKKEYSIETVELTDDKINKVCNSLSAMMAEARHRFSKSKELREESLESTMWQAQVVISTLQERISENKRREELANKEYEKIKSKLLSTQE